MPHPKHASTSTTAIIASTTVSAALLLALTISLLKLYWNARKKAKKLQVANAQLQDATNPDGVSQRISALISGVSALGHGGAEAPAYGGKEMPDGGGRESELVGTVGFPYTRYGDCGLDKHDIGTSQPATQGGREAGYDVQQGVSNDMLQGIGGGRRMSEYSESDYGSTRRRSWEDLLAAGGQEVRPLRVGKKGVW